MCRSILQKVALFFVTLTYTQLPLPKYEPFKNDSCCLVFLVEVTCILLFLVPSPRKDLSSNDLRTTYISGNSLHSRGLRPLVDHSTRRVAQVLHALGKATVGLKSYYTGLRFTPPPMPKPHSPKRRINSRLLPAPLNQIPSEVIPPSLQSYNTKGISLHLFRPRRCSREPLYATKTRQSTTLSSSLPLHTVKVRVKNMPR